jgi:hypothetical protein
MYAALLTARKVNFPSIARDVTAKAEDQFNWINKNSGSSNSTHESNVKQALLLFGKDAQVENVDEGTDEFEHEEYLVETLEWLLIKVRIAINRADRIGMANDRVNVRLLSGQLNDAYRRAVISSIFSWIDLTFPAVDEGAT